MSRRAARENLFKLIYEYNVTNAENKFSLSLLTTGMDEDDFLYVNTVYKGIIENRELLLEKIGRYSSSFAVSRIYKIDLALLLIAAYEIVFIDDIPDSVSANEATELAKVYSTEKSYSFVNGVLASIIKEKKSDGKIN